MIKTEESYSYRKCLYCSTIISIKERNCPQCGAPNEYYNNWADHNNDFIGLHPGTIISSSCCVIYTNPDIQSSY
jgi:hypothetical protein